MNETKILVCSPSGELQWVNINSEDVTIKDGVILVKGDNTLITDATIVPDKKNTIGQKSQIKVTPIAYLDGNTLYVAGRYIDLALPQIKETNATIIEIFCDNIQEVEKFFENDGIKAILDKCANILLEPFIYFFNREDCNGKGVLVGNKDGAIILNEYLNKIPDKSILVHYPEYYTPLYSNSLFSKKIFADIFNKDVTLTNLLKREAVYSYSRDNVLVDRENKLFMVIDTGNEDKKYIAEMMNTKYKDWTLYIFSDDGMYVLPADSDFSKINKEWLKEHFFKDKQWQEEVCGKKIEFDKENKFDLTILSIDLLKEIIVSLNDSKFGYKLSKYLYFKNNTLYVTDYYIYENIKKINIDGITVIRCSTILFVVPTPNQEELNGFRKSDIGNTGCYYKVIELTNNNNKNKFVIIDKSISKIICSTDIGNYKDVNCITQDNILLTSKWLYDLAMQNSITKIEIEQEILSDFGFESHNVFNPFGWGQVSFFHRSGCLNKIKFNEHNILFDDYDFKALSNIYGNDVIDDFLNVYYSNYYDYRKYFRYNQQYNCFEYQVSGKYYDWVVNHYDNSPDKHKYINLLNEAKNVCEIFKALNVITPDNCVAVTYNNFYSNLDINVIDGTFEFCSPFKYVTSSCLVSFSYYLKTSEINLQNLRISALFGNGMQAYRDSNYYMRSISLKSSSVNGTKATLVLHYVKADIDKDPAVIFISETKTVTVDVVFGERVSVWNIDGEEIKVSFFERTNKPILKMYGYGENYNITSYDKLAIFDVLSIEQKEDGFVEVKIIPKVKMGKEEQEKFANSIIIDDGIIPKGEV